MLICQKLVEEVWARKASIREYLLRVAERHILAMELRIMNSLEWDLIVPTPETYITRYLRVASPPTEDPDQERLLRHHAGYLLDFSLCRRPPSEVATAAVVAAGRALGRLDVFPPALERHSGFELKELQGCVLALKELQGGASEQPHQAVVRKYSEAEYCKVAMRFGII